MALVLAVGVVAGFSSTYLVEAGVPAWLVLVLAVLALLVPVIAAARSGDRHR